MELPRLRADCLVSEGMELPELLSRGRLLLRDSRPCATGETIWEVEPAEPLRLDFPTLRTLFELSRPLSTEPRYSAALGVVRCWWGKGRVTLFWNGKVRIQGHLGKEEALRIAGSVYRLAWGAFPCRVCGGPSLRCASGECGACVEGWEEAEEGGEVLSPLLEGGREEASLALRRLARGGR
jgi:hypothetical protein